MLIGVRFHGRLVDNGRITRIGIKLDANKNKKFDAALGGGAFSLPPFKSKVFEGNFAINGTSGPNTNTDIIGSSQG